MVRHSKAVGGNLIGVNQPEFIYLTDLKTKKNLLKKKRNKDGCLYRGQKNRFWYKVINSSF